MNTNNVYYVKIYRLVKIEYYGDSFFNHGKKFESNFSRDTLVYQNKNGKFYDLIGKKHLNGNLDYFSEPGTEFVNLKYLIPFNEVIKQTKENLSKRKIKKLYMEHKNNV